MAQKDDFMSDVSKAPASAPSTGASTGPSTGPSTGAEIGRRLRLRRKVRRLTLAQVAQASHISTAQLRQIERGRAMLSVDKMVLLCQALDMPLSWLFDPAYHDAPLADRQQYVIRQAAQRHMSFAAAGMEKDMLTPDSMLQLQMMRIVLSPTGTTGDDPYNEPEGAKGGVVLRGALGLEIDGHTEIVHPGDSFAFPATAMIRFWAEGVETEVIWVTTPAFY